MFTGPFKKITLDLGSFYDCLHFLVWSTKKIKEKSIFFTREKSNSFQPITVASSSISSHQNLTKMDRNTFQSAKLIGKVCERCWIEVSCFRFLFLQIDTWLAAAWKPGKKIIIVENVDVYCVSDVEWENEKNLLLIIFTKNVTCITIFSQNISKISFLVNWFNFLSEPQCLA